MSRNPESIERAAREARDTGTGWARGFCPVCEERTGKADRKGSWSISLSTGYWTCWKCGGSGVLRDRKAPEVYVEPPPVEPPRLPVGFLPLAHGPGRTAEVCAAAREYLAGRGIGPRLAEEAGIGFVPDWMRVVVPIYGVAGLRGWVARSIVPTERTYLYPKGFSRADTLYNEACLDVESAEPALVVEGVFDALAWWPRSVAVLGKPSDWQVARLSAARRPIAVCLDGDAWREGWALAMQLRLNGQSAGCIRLPPGLDPDEVDGLAEAALECLTQEIVEV